MSTQNTALLGERFNEIAAVAACQQKLQSLHSLATEPSSKRYARSRDQRGQLWSELEAFAAQAGARTAQPQPVARTARKRSQPAAAAPAPTEPATQVA